MYKLSFAPRRERYFTKRLNAAPKVFSTDVEAGHALQSATPKGIPHFFENWCVDRPCEGLGWSVLYTDSENTYYGKKEAYFGTSIVRKVFVVDSQELNTSFPIFEEVNGTTLHALVKGYLDELRPKHAFRMLETFPFVPLLKRDGIEMHVDWQYQIDDAETTHIQLCLFLPWKERGIKRLY